MTFTACTGNPIENVKSYELNNYLISFRYGMQRQAVDGNHKSKSNLIRKFAPYVDAMNRYIFNCKETTSGSKKVYYLLFSWYCLKIWSFSMCIWIVVISWRPRRENELAHAHLAFSIWFRAFNLIGLTLRQPVEIKNELMHLVAWYLSHNDHTWQYLKRVYFSWNAWRNSWDVSFLCSVVRFR